MTSLFAWKRLAASSLTFAFLGLGTTAWAAPSAQVIWSSEKNPGDGAWFNGPLSVPHALSPQANIALTSPTSTAATTLAVDPSVQYQTMLGIGTSMEESTVFNLSRMSLAKRTEVLKKLLDPASGAGMNLLRITFGTSDFTGRQFYTYDDRPAGQTDTNLTYFSIQKDIDYNIISTLKQALAVNPNLKIFASPWSPPAWMKDNKSLIGGKLLTQYIPVLATYYRKAVQAYEAQGIPLYALTVQNEPQSQAPDYPSASVDPAQARQLIVALRNELNAHGLSTRIWAFDHNFDSALAYVAPTLNDAAGNAATDGVAFHDYAGDPGSMTQVRNAYPNKNILMTERSVWGTSGADRMAQYFRNWAAGYNSWVTLLDSNIQPEQWTGTPGPTLLIQSASSHDSYWALPEVSLIGQYARYVKAGARRISSSYGSASTVTHVSFLNPDNTLVSVVINQTASSQRFKLDAEGWELLATLPAKTVGTYVWKRENAPTAINLLSNPGFEADGTLSSWNAEWHNAELAHKVDTDFPYTGNYKLTHYSAAAYQQISGQSRTVANGAYRASVWVRSSGGQRALRLYSKGHGGAEVTAEIGSNAVTGWTKYTLDNIQVTSGFVEVGVYSDANAQNWAAFDQFELVKQ
ncbi:MAG: glycoside hydrolase family 30 beta sandwich domain-containing protein [Cystobacter sp.]